MYETWERGSNMADHPQHTFSFSKETWSISHESLKKKQKTNKNKNKNTLFYWKKKNPFMCQTDPIFPIWEFFSFFF